MNEDQQNKNEETQTSKTPSSQTSKDALDAAASSDNTNNDPQDAVSPTPTSIQVHGNVALSRSNPDARVSIDIVSSTIQGIIIEAEDIIKAVAKVTIRSAVSLRRHHTSE